MKLRRLPGQLWRNSGETADQFAEAVFRRRPGKWTMQALRALFILFAVLLGPWILLARAFRPPRERAWRVLHRRVEEVWRTSPFQALDLVRTSYETLQSRGDGWKKVDLPPFGRFDLLDTHMVHDLLYRCEFALGRYEEALQVAASVPMRHHASVLQQVDCLMAMGRRAAAISLLEKNLDVDTWRGPLRRRHEELSGHGGGGVN